MGEGLESRAGEAERALRLPAALPGLRPKAVPVMAPVAPMVHPIIEKRPPAALHCLSAACLTLTPAGLRPLAALAAGDLVLTRDQGFRPLVWVGARSVSAAELQAAPDGAPVRIAQGALGGGLPDRDLLVSPRHRLLICGPQSLACFGEHEVLVPAIHLVGLPGVTRHRPNQAMDYVQLVFAEHQVIRCDGTWCESFQPTPAALAGLDPAARTRLLLCLPQALAEGAYPPARRSLQRDESRLLFTLP